MKKRKGFTLIELMIVIAIIAILAAVLVPNFMRAREASRLTACKSNLKNIATAAETYSTDYNGVYPGSSTKAEIKSGTGSLGRLAKDYLQKDLKCPAAAAYYTFAKSGDGVKYWVYCPANSNSGASGVSNKHRKNNVAGGPYLDSEAGISEYPQTPW